MSKLIVSLRMFYIWNRSTVSFVANIHWTLFGEFLFVPVSVLQHLSYMTTEIVLDRYATTRSVY